MPCLMMPESGTKMSPLTVFINIADVGKKRLMGEECDATVKCRKYYSD